MNPATKQQWVQYFREKALKDCFEKDSQQHFNAANWFFGRQIRIARTKDISPAVVDHVARGIDELLQDIGLSFEIVDTETPASIDEYALYAVKEGNIDEHVLFSLLAASKNALYADVVLTPKYLIGGTEHWGVSSFTHGASILALPAERQHDLEFIKNMAKHEAVHLFGYYFHHDDYKIEGYSEPQDCVTYWRASTNYLCGKCKDALKEFWRGIEQNSGERFLR
ncbi:hypothetical protein HY484_02045 [Candidatus Woesearchaeota archaeon]|nr:hypothetical protein [Candidatus Woesearchaeota archaeon]